MKILCMSLLRLGDIFQHRLLVKSLRQKYPRAEIHFLIHDEFKHCQELIPEVNGWHFFPKAVFEENAHDPKAPLFITTEKVAELLQTLNTHQWAVAYNFTHTKLSAYMMEGVTALRKKGLRSQGGLFAGLDNPWIRYFNRHFSEDYDIGFHYIELLAKSLDLSPPPLSRPTFSNRKMRILWQLDSADSKKQIDKTRVANWVRILNLEFPEIESVVLSSPQHMQDNTKLFRGQVMNASLAEVQKELQAARWLFTVDTAIKHIATACGTPILEFAVGSADCRKTGAWQDGAMILESHVPCFPCAHRDPCAQPEHYCSLALSDDLVLRSIRYLLSGAMKANHRNYGFDCVSEGHMGYQIDGTVRPRAYNLLKKYIFSSMLEGRDLRESLTLGFKKITCNFEMRDLQLIAEEMEFEYLCLGAMKTAINTQNYELNAGFAIWARGAAMTPWWLELAEKFTAQRPWSEIENLFEMLLKNHLAIRNCLSQINTVGGVNVTNSRDEIAGNASPY